MFFVLKVELKDVHYECRGTAKPGKAIAMNRPAVPLRGNYIDLARSAI